MNSSNLLTKVCSKPSRRVLRKAVCFAQASSHSLNIYAEDYRRSEEHTFLDFLIKPKESSARYDDFFVQWCNSILEIIEDIHSELELPMMEVNFNLLTGNSWEHKFIKEQKNSTNIFLIDYSKGIIAFQLLRELFSQGHDILLLTDIKWQQPLKVASAIDPLHRNDKNAEIDKEIISRSLELQKRLNANISLVYCQYVAPYLYRYSKEILAHQKQSITNFLELNKHALLPLRFIKSNPEEGLPDIVKSMGASILVLGACKRTALSRYWSGSTVDTLMANPPCDLLLINK
ncbi:universal stress protein [Vibrio crassostreae]|uniref:universal stress protein n=1 Tax=Vibrio crassostreae TaxID=246167 RepID=UPI0010492D4C|nr:universal stress protein [Vibrio crassostreae]TCO03544.1 nucleotide-binding universal stress UspA family protein [Vibrio crassostreae]CAK1732887.1 Nucleotide-binding universal stress UspA family protein [Vibrio crassostreae]CAK1787917.1 Nucleotide-binding universal stress UspA family protein [Vibrio crassostreae]CAK1978762.1 Nucleotide-binding universal stress UspA family protein [Vibrio crassostreae]CAK2175420.1 Nucleotide-binding universal stress UspA family protein [Vibrio crassostreae]